MNDFWINGMICCQCGKSCGLEWTLYKGTLLHPDCVDMWIVREKRR